MNCKVGTKWRYWQSLFHAVRTSWLSAVRTPVADHEVVVEGFVDAIHPELECLRSCSAYRGSSDALTLSKRKQHGLYDTAVLLLTQHKMGFGTHLQEHSRGTTKRLQQNQAQVSSCMTRLRCCSIYNRFKGPGCSAGWLQTLHTNRTRAAARTICDDQSARWLVQEDDLHGTTSHITSRHQLTGRIFTCSCTSQVQVLLLCHKQQALVPKHHDNR